MALENLQGNTGFCRIFTLGLIKSTVEMENENCLGLLSRIEEIEQLYSKDMQTKCIPNLILLTLNSLANFSSSRISGESMSIGSSTNLLFRLSSCLKSGAEGSSARRGWCMGGKPWLKVWSGNL